MELRFKWMMLLFVGFSLFFVSCKDKNDDVQVLVGNWDELGDFGGYPRSQAVSFVIGDAAYAGTGYFGGNDVAKRLSDFWKYDAVLDEWNQVSDLPGVSRNNGVGFSVANKGYVGTGFDGENNLNDFYQYDPALNTWKAISPFAGSARRGAVAFSIPGYDFGYVGTGYDESDMVMKDFYAYNPANDTWTKIKDIKGSKRYESSVFVVDSKAYVCLGRDNNGLVKDLNVFTPSNNLAEITWTDKRPLANVSTESYDDSYQMMSYGAVAFNVGTMGYVTTGIIGTGSVSKRTWEYNTLTDLWAERTELEGSARYESLAFTVNNKAYIFGGQSGSSFFDDVWTFDPAVSKVDND